jgi:hypothetical protein
LQEEEAERLEDERTAARLVAEREKKARKKERQRAKKAAEQAKKEAEDEERRKQEAVRKAEVRCIAFPRGMLWHVRLAATVRSVSMGPS